MNKLQGHQLETKLRADNTALLMIDHQTGLIQLVPSVEPGQLRMNILALGEVGWRFKLPTVLATSWAEGPNGPTIPALAAMFPGQKPIERDTVDVWDHPETVAAIRATNRPKLLIAGLDTTTCVALTAIGAVRAGFDAYAVVDASSTVDDLNQTAAMMRMTMAGVVVTTWGAVLAEIAANTITNGIHIADVLGKYSPTYTRNFEAFMATAESAEKVGQQLDAARAAIGGDAGQA